MEDCREILKLAEMAAMLFAARMDCFVQHARERARPIPSSRGLSNVFVALGSPRY